MVMDHYLTVDGTEIYNSARLQAYINAGLIQGYDRLDACGCPTFTERSLGSCYLNLPGIEGNAATTPDKAAFAVGDDELDLRLPLLSAIHVTDGVLMSQWEECDNRGWLWVLREDGYLSFRASEDGVATTIAALSTAPLPSFANVVPRVVLDPLIVAPDSCSLMLDGSGDFASTADSALLDVTVLDARAAVKLSDYTRASTQVIIAKDGTNQRSYLCQITTAGLMQIVTSPNGTTGSQIIGTASAAPGFVDNTAYGLRWTCTPDNGAAQRVYSYYKRTLDLSDDVLAQINSEAGWTLVSTHTVAGATSIHVGTGGVRVGRSFTGAETFGEVYAAVIKNGIAGVVGANPDFANAPPGTAGFTDGTGNVWAMNGNAFIDCDTSWVLTFYTRAIGCGPEIWQQLGDVVTGSPGLSVFDSTAPVLVGAAG